MTELKPCPFCGGEASLYHGDSTDGYIKGTQYVEAFCGWCGARIRDYSDAKVMEKWNNRPNTWHTGTPTEDGQHFVAFRWGLDNKIMHDMASRILYGATTFTNGEWKINYPYVVSAWQRIEPYKEASE